MLIHSEAWTIWISGFAVPGQRGARSARSSAGWRISSGPTKWTRTSKWRHARTAPRTSGSGARSEPIPSTTMSIGIWRVVRGAGLTCFLDCDHFATLVLSALAADAVGKLTLVAVGALGGADRGEEVVAAPLCGALLGVAAFRIRHCSFPFMGPMRSWIMRAAMVLGWQ